MSYPQRIKHGQKLIFKADKYFTELYFTPIFAAAFVKIGYFNTDDDLAFQDEIHGNLFEQVEKAMDLLLTKYLNAPISYKGLHRIEQYPIPEPALREAVLNAIVHKDYSSGIPIQISVYANKLMIWNEGQLPDNWTVARLKRKHPSHPYNPDIANCFFRAGLIESWGRGTIKILNECKRAKVATPSFKYDLSCVIIEFKYKALQQPVTISNIKIKGSTTDKILYYITIDGSITIPELAEKTGVSLSTIERTIKYLQNENKINRVGSKKAGYWLII